MGAVPKPHSQDRAWLVERVREIYQEKYGERTLRDFARSAGYNYRTLRSIACSLGVVRECRRWTQEESNILEAHAHKPIRKLQEILKQSGFTRNYYAICRRIKELNLRDKHGSNNGYFTATQVAQGLGVLPDTVFNWIAKGYLQSKEGYGKTHAIAPAALKKFITTYPGKIDLRKIPQPVWFIDILAR